MPAANQNLNLTNLKNNIFAGERFDDLMSDLQKTFFIQSYNVSLVNDIETLKKIYTEDIGSPFIQTLVPKPRRAGEELTHNVRQRLFIQLEQNNSISVIPLELVFVALTH